MTAEETRHAELTARLDRIEALTRIGAKNVLGVEEAALLTGFSVTSVYRMTSERRIPHSKRNGRLYFRKDELDAWLTRDRMRIAGETESDAETYINLKRQGHGNGKKN